MNEIDNRIVQLEFDNQEFEKNVKTTVKSLDELKESLELEGSTESLKKLEEASKNISFDDVASSIEGVGKSVDSIANKFTLMGTIGQKVIGQLADTIVNATESAAAFFTTSNLAGGFEKYSSATKATQTILAAVKDTYYNGDKDAALVDIKDTLAQLQKYTDETSYSFSEMATTIGKFTAAGIKLKDAETAMEGISNAAAKAGVGVQGANMAMAQVSQGIAKGYFQVVDWQSLENYNIATADFKQTILDAAVAVGDLTQTTDGYYKTAKGTLVTVENFRTTLSEKWLTSNSFLQAMNYYADQTTQFGKEAYESAQKALTFSDAIQAIKDSMTTGWMKTFEYVFGDLDESIDLWTNFCNAIINVTSAFDEWRNTILETWHDVTGYDNAEKASMNSRQVAVQALADVGNSLINVLYSLRDGFSEVFGEMDSFGSWSYDGIVGGLVNATEKLSEFGSAIKETFGYYDSANDEDLSWDDGNQGEKRYAYIKQVADGVDAVSSAAQKASNEFVILNDSIDESQLVYSKLAWDQNLLGNGYRKVGEYVEDTTAAFNAEVDTLKKGSKDASNAIGAATNNKKKNTNVWAESDTVMTEEGATAVKDLQKRLLSLGYDSLGSADGVFGSKTEKALKEFQKSVGLTATGIYDQNTHNALIKQLKKEGKYVGQIQAKVEYFNQRGATSTVTQMLTNIGELLSRTVQYGGQVIGFIVDSAALVIQTVSPILNFVFSIVNGVLEIVNAVLKCRNEMNMFSVALSILQSILYPIERLLHTIFDPLSNIVSSVSDVISDSLVTAFEDFASILETVGYFATSGVITVIDKIISFFEAYKRYSTLVESGFKENEIDNFIKNLDDDDALKTFVKSCRTIYGWVQTISKAITDLFTLDDGTSVFGVISEYIDAIKVLFGGGPQGDDNSLSQQIYGDKKNQLKTKVGEIKEVWTGFKTFVSTIWDSVVTFAKGIPSVGGSIIDWFSDLFKKVDKKTLSESGSDIVSWLGNIRENVSNFFSAGFFPTLTNIWTRFTEWLSDKWEQISSSSTWSTLSNALSDAFSYMFGVIDRIGAWLREKFGGIFEILFPEETESNENVIAKGIEDTADSMSKAQSTFETVLNWFEEHIGKKISQIIDLIFPKSPEYYGRDDNSLAGEISKNADNTRSAVSDVKTIWDTILGTLKSVFNSVMTFFSTVFGFEWKNPFEEADDAFKESEESSKEAKDISETLRGIWQSITSTFHDVISWIENIFGIKITTDSENTPTSEAKESIEEMSADSEESKDLFDRIEEIWESVKTVWNSIVGFIASIFGMRIPKSNTDEIVGSEEEILDATEKSSGIASTIDNLISGITGVWDSIVGFFKSLFGIEDASAEASDTAENTATNAITIGSAVDDVIGFLSNVWQNIRKFLSDAFGWEMPESEQTPVTEIDETLTEMNADVDNAQTIGETIDEKIKWLKNLFSEIASGIVEVFNSLFGIRTADEIAADNGRDDNSLAGEISKDAEHLEETKTIGETIQDIIDELIKIKDKIVEKAKELWTDISNLWNSIFGSSEESSEDGDKAVGEAKKQKTVFQTIHDVFEDISEVVSSIVNGSFFNELGTKLSEKFKDNEIISGILEFLQIGTEAGEVAEESKDGTQKTKSVVSSVVEWIGNILSSIVDLGGSLLSGGAKYIGSLINTLLVVIPLFFVIRTFNLAVMAVEDITSLASVPWTIAYYGGIIIAIGQLINLIKTVENIDPSKIGNLAVVFGSLIVMILAITNFTNTIMEFDAVKLGQATPALFGIAAIFVSLGIVMYAIAKSMSIIGSMKIEDLGKGLGAIVLLALAIAVFVKVMSGMNFSSMNAGAWKTILAFGIFAVMIGILAGSVTMLSKLAPDKLAQGIKAVIILLAALAGFILALDYFGTLQSMMSLDVSKISNLKGFALAILEISASIILIAGAILILSLIPNELFNRGAARIVGIIAGIIAMVAAFGLLDKFGVVNFNYKSISLMLLAISGSMLMLSATLVILSTMDFGSFAGALGKLFLLGAIVVAIVAVMEKFNALTALSRMNGDLKGATKILVTFVGIALTVAILAGAIWLIRDVDTATIATFGVIVAALMLTVAVVLTAASALSTTLKSGFMAMSIFLGIALIIGSVAASLYFIAKEKIPTETILSVCGGLVAIFTGIALMMASMAIFTKVLGATSFLSVGITLLAIVGIIGAVMGSLYLLTKSGVNASEITSYITAVSGLFEGIAFLAAGLAAVGLAVSVNAAAALGAVIIIDLLVASLAGLAYGFGSLGEKTKEKIVQGFELVGEAVGAFKGAKLAGQIKGFANGLKAIDESGIDSDRMQALVSVLTAFQEFSNGLGENKSGWQKTMEGFGFMSQFQVFASDLVYLSTGLKKLAEVMNSAGFDKITYNNVNNVIKAINPIKELAEGISGLDSLKKGGFLGLGDSAFETFLKSLGLFAEKLRVLNVDLSGFSEDSATELYNKVVPLSDAAKSIGECAQLFVDENGKSINLGKHYDNANTALSAIIGETETGSGWIGFLHTLGLFGQKVSEMNSAAEGLGSISVEDSQALKTKLDNITPALEGIAGIYSAIASVPEMSTDQEYAAEMLSTYMKTLDPDNENFIGTNWTLFISSLSSFATQVVSMGQTIQAATDAGLNEKFASDYIEPLAPAIEGIATMYNSMAGITLDPIKDDTGNTILDNTAFSNFLGHLVTDEEGEMGFANQMVKFAEAIMGWDEANKEVTGTALTSKINEKSFSDISGNVVSAAQSVADIVTTLAGAQAALEESGYANGGVDVQLFGEKGLFNMFTTAIGDDIEDNDITSLGEAITKYATMLQKIEEETPDFPDNSDKALDIISGIAEFFTALSSGGTDKNGNEIKLTKSDFSDGLIENFFGGQGIIYRFSEALGSDDGSSIGDAVRTFYSKVNEIFGTDKLTVDDNTLNERVSYVMTTLSTVAGFFHNITAEGSDLQLTTDGLDVVDEFVDSLLNSGFTEDGGILKAFDVIDQNTSNYKDVDGQNEVLERVKRAIESLKEIAGFIKNVSDTSSDLYLGSGLYLDSSEFIQPITAIQTVLTTANSVADETGVANLELFAKALTSLSTIFTTIATMNDGNGDATQKVQELSSVFNELKTMLSGTDYTEAENSASAGVEGVADKAVASGTSEMTSFKRVGSSWASALATGIRSNSDVAVRAAKEVADKMVQSARNAVQQGSPAGKFIDIGYWCVMGLKVGLEKNSGLAALAGQKVANETIEETEETAGVDSPAKVFQALGKSIDQSMADGINSSTSLVNGSASDLITAAMKSVDDFMSSGVNTEPTIRPIMDLSDVERSASLLGDMIPSSASIGVRSESLAQLAQSAGAIGRNQNGINSNNTYNNQSYGGLSFAGATFNVRSDNDIKGIATELANLNKINMQNRGII